MEELSRLLARLRSHYEILGGSVEDGISSDFLNQLPEAAQRRVMRLSREIERLG